MSMFPSLNDSARLWIWVADRPLSDTEKTALETGVERFIAQWTSHGRRVHGAAAVLHDQVLVLAAEIPEAEISGCGIDKSVHVLERAARESGFEWSPSLAVPLVDTDAGQVVFVRRDELRQRAADGRLTSDTPIIDRTLTELGTLRSTGLMRRAADTWTARYLRPRPTEAG